MDEPDNEPIDSNYRSCPICGEPYAFKLNGALDRWRCRGRCRIGGDVLLLVLRKERVSGAIVAAQRIVEFLRLNPDLLGRFKPEEPRKDIPQRPRPSNPGRWRKYPSIR